MKRLFLNVAGFLFSFLTILDLVAAFVAASDGLWVAVPFFLVGAAACGLTTIIIADRLDGA